MAERKTFLLRISPDLWDDLARWSAQELRSVNGQIEFLLRRAVDQQFGPGRRRRIDEGDGRSEPDRPRKGR